MSVSLENYKGLLDKTAESLRWLRECGLEHVEIPQGWQIPNLVHTLGAVPRSEVVLDPSVQPAEREVNGSASDRLGILLNEVKGTAKADARKRAVPKTSSTDTKPRIPPRHPELPPNEASQMFEAFLEEENIVDPLLRMRFKRVLNFDRLKTEYLESARCPVCRGRQEPVLPTMGRDCRAVFIADQPDEREQLMGVPYVGETGSLVAKMVKAMGLTREQVGYAYVNSCSHPEASAEELAEHWKPLLDQYLALANPEVIVAFGECAARRLTGQTLAFPHLRGQWFEYKGTPVLSTFHPTALIQHPAGKSVVWGDLKNVMRKLGLSPTKG